MHGSRYQSDATKFPVFPVRQFRKNGEVADCVLQTRRGGTIIAGRAQSMVRPVPLVSLGV